MKALIITDTHLKEENISLVEDIWSQAINFCKDNGIKLLLFGGDFFHSRKGQPLSVIMAGRRIVNGLADNGIDVMAISGNHSKMDYDSEDSYLDIYESNQFKIFKSGHSSDIFKDFRLHFLPYFKESGTYLDRLSQLKESLDKSKKNVLLTHIAINGSLNNENAVISNTLSSEHFKEFDKVFVGHFHNQQEFENIKYIGSAYQANYGEDNQKGFTILNEDMSTEFIKAKFPEFAKYEINVEDLDSATIADLSKERKESGSNIKLIIKGDESKVKSFDTSVLTDLGISFDKRQNDAIRDISDEEMKDSVTFDKESIGTAFKEFCKHNKILDMRYGLDKIKNL